MTRKHWILLAFTVLLGGMSIYLNTDWFRRDDIQISHRARPERFLSRGRKRSPGARTALSFAPMFFEFDRRLKLTDVRVIPVSDLQTNQHPHPIWHMVSDSNSVPTKGIMYGEFIPGMRPEVKGATPDPLEPGTSYCLRLQAGPIKTDHQFTAQQPIQ
jgi:hypothetical protein